MRQTYYIMFAIKKFYNGDREIMKKKAIILFALSSFFALGVAVGCKKSQAEVPNGFYVTADSFLRWNEIKGAEEYLVNIDGTEYRADKNEIDIFDICTESKKYEIKVRAYGKKISLSDAGEYFYNTKYPDAFGYKSTSDGSGVEIIVMNEEKLPANVVVPSEIDGYTVVALGNNTFFKCKSVTSVYMPDSITTMGGGAFFSCQNLERIRLSSHIEKFETLSFFGCKKMKNIELPAGLKQISSAAFDSCAKLEKIELPESLNTLDLSAFIGCESLKRLEIPKYTESLSPSGLDVEEIIIHPENKNYYVLNNCILRKDNNVIVAGGQYSTIPEEATAIGQRAFYQSRLTQINIPANIKTIEDKAFSFSLLNEITIANGVEEINLAFTNCKLKKLTIPASVKKIERLFSGDCDVEELSVSPGNKVYYSEDNCILTREGDSIVAGILSRNPIPAVAKEIGQYAFADHSYLKVVTIPANIKKVCGYAFVACENLGKVIFEGGEVIESLAFMDCRNLTAVRISKNVKKVEQEAFSYTNVTSFTLPHGINLEGNNFYSFYATVYYPNGIDLSKITYRGSLIECESAYENGFPYVKSIKSNLITSGYGNLMIMTPEYTSYKLIIPERDGYTFEGWSKSEDCRVIDYPVDTVSEYWNSDLAFLFLGYQYTYNPFFDYPKNTVYDPSVKVLYAVWKKI